MKEKKNTGLLVIVVILCLLIGGVGGYFVSTNFLSKNESNNQNNTSNENATNENNTIVDNNEQSQCKYQKLKDPVNLTQDEKNKIVLALEAGEEPFIDKNTLKIVYNSESEFVYEVTYETIKKEGLPLIDLVWNKNGVYEYYGGGSGLLSPEVDEIIKTINTECGIAK